MPVDAFDALESETITLDASTASYYWTKFCNKTANSYYYYAPGCALFYDATGYMAASDAQFGPLTLGGLYVTSPQTVGDSPVYYSIIGSGDRKTELGDPTGKKETFFVFDESFTISRNDSNSIKTPLYGVVNISVASDKTFALNTDYTATILTTAGDTAPVLKMSGAGKFAVSSLDASTGTLDFGGVTATPFIQGNLTVSANTCLVLPSGTAENAAYVLCSGTLTAPAKTVQTTVQVGDGEAFTGYVTYNTTTKSVSYSTTAPSYTGTVDGTTITWDTAELTNDDIAGANITLTGSGEVTLPAEPISINAGSDVTVDVTGYTTAAYSGEGTFKYTSGYPTSVPAGMTYWYVGSDDSTQPTAIANVSVSGSLKMSGYASLTGYSQATTGSLDIVGDATSLAGSSCALHGNVTVRADATLTLGASDMPDYNGTSFNLYVYGTLNCGSTRQSINGSMALTFYTGATITGSGDGNTSGNDSTFDFFAANANTRFVLADGAESGTVNFNAPISMRGVNVTWTIDSGVTVDWAGDATKGCTSSSASNCTGALLKAGAGTLKLSGVMNKGSVTLNAGTLDVAATQAVTMTYGAASAAITASNSAVVTGTITLGSSSGSPIAPSSDTQTFLKDSTKWQGTLTVPEINRSSTSSALSLPLYNWGNSQSAIVLNATTTSNNWLGGEDAVAAEVSLAGDFALDNGGSGQTYTFNNVTGSSGKNLKLYAWSGANNNNVTYAIGQFNNFAGTVQVINASTHKDGCALTLNVGNIVATAAYNTPLVAITTSITSSTGGDKSVTVNLANATLNGSAANLVYDTDGIYLAAATYGGENYATVQKAIDAAGDEHLADIVVADSSAEVPEGYALVGGTKVRKGGGEIYWTDGTYWAESGGTAVFSTAASGGETTTYAAGDTVVIPDTTTRYLGAIGDGAKLKYDCNGTITIYKSGDIESALKNAEVTVAAGTTLQFARATWSGTPQPEIVGCSFAGEGAITVPSGTTLAVSGNVSSAISFGGEGTVNVASDATLAFSGSATVSSTLAGSGEVSFATLPSSALTLGDWTGTVELPVLAANQAYQLNNYGKTGSTIRLNGLSAGWLAVATPITVNANLELAGDWNLAAMSTRVYNFATVSGTGNMSFATTENQPTSINIATLSGYSGAITNNTTATLTIGTLALDSGADVTAGAKLLSTGGTGSFSVTAVTVGGEAQTLNLSYRSDGVYVRGASVASYDNVEYETIAEAIAAAVEDGHTYEDVTILDATAECPAGYYVDTEHNNVLTKYQAAIVKMDESKVYFKTPQLAFDDIAANANLITYMQGYVCVEVYSGTDVAISINASATIWAMGVPVKIRCLNSATVSVTTTATESTLTAGTADENGIVTYSSSPVATTYVWAGTAGTAANWSSPAKWKVGSAEGATASRAPGSTDTVVFSDGASVSGVSGISVAALQVSGTVTFTGGGSLTSASAITLGTGDSITITGTLSPVPTTAVADSYVKATTSGSTTTYMVATQPTVSDVAFEYGADYATATVTATVTGDATAYTLTVGQNSYDGVVSGSTVTFSNVATGHASAYDSVSYTITAKDGETAVPVTSGGAGTAIVADVTAAGWINENATTTGTSAGGSWTNAVTYTDGKAEISDNMFEASTASTASQVVLEFNVCFSAVSDADVEGNPQAAVKLGEVDSATTFMVLTNGNNWAAVSNAGLTPDASATYKVVLTIDYGTGSYGVTVGDNALTNATGSASFPLAASKTSVQNIAFAGSGVLTSMRGDQREGYMVVDKNGRRYPTIDAAIDAYNADSTIGPLTLLHAGTAPSGWKIEDNTLIKLPQGFYFIAY